MSTIRFLLYIVALACGLAGVWIGGKPVVIHVVDRIDGVYSTDYDDLFRAAAILLLSLILLILVHLAHELVDIFGLKAAAKKLKGPLTNLSGTPWDPKRQVPGEDSGSERHGPG